MDIKRAFERLLMIAVFVLVVIFGIKFALWYKRSLTADMSNSAADQVILHTQP